MNELQKGLPTLQELIELELPGYSVACEKAEIEGRMVLRFTFTPAVGYTMALVDSHALAPTIDNAKMIAGLVVDAQEMMVKYS